MGLSVAAFRAPAGVTPTLSFVVNGFPPTVRPPAAAAAAAADVATGSTSPKGL